MRIEVSYLLFFFLCARANDAVWDTALLCPMVCTCRLERLFETSIYQFTQNEKIHQHKTETDNHINNDVLYEEDLEENFQDDNALLRTATCLLQTETDALNLLEKLPKNVESLTLIQGAEAGKKVIKFTDLRRFDRLIALELRGTKVNESVTSNFFCEINAHLNVKYLNLDKIYIKVEGKEIAKLSHEVREEVITFEYTQQLHPNIHPLTLLQQSNKGDILPYNKYVQQESEEGIPLFYGFNQMLLLRISGCDLININWEMFEGLHNLQHLILEKNKLMYIPDFAFYGTPNLKSLSLANNNLLNVQVTDLAGLLELEYLDLSSNNFSQLSELSFPPFPKLKLANFKDNPIGVVFPNTFDVMNTTDSLILGGQDTPLILIKNSFLGLKLLKKLILHNLVVSKLHRELLVGMPNLNELIMSGNVSTIEFDAFLDILKLEKLVISSCKLQNISMDAFMGLSKLEVLDLSQNLIKAIPPGTFDPLNSLVELYLNNNQLFELPRDLFTHIHPRLIRLTENPWHCSCKMSDWKPVVINKIKQKTVKMCSFADDKRTGCGIPHIFETKYVFDTRVAPKCVTPEKYINWNIFHVMRKQLKCSEYRPKLKKKFLHSADTSNATRKNNEQENATEISLRKSTFKKMTKAEYKEKMQKLKKKKIDGKLRQTDPIKISFFKKDDENNDLNVLNNYASDSEEKEDFNSDETFHNKLYAIKKVLGKNNKYRTN